MIKVGELRDAHVGQRFYWPLEQPHPTPFVYLGLWVSVGAEPSILIQQDGKPPASMMLEIWENETLFYAD